MYVIVMLVSPNRNASRMFVVAFRVAFHRSLVRRARTSSRERVSF